MTLRFLKTAILFAGAACGVAWTTGAAAAQSCAVGVNVNSFQNFIIMPLTFLSGVFYSIHSLPPLGKM